MRTAELDYDLPAELIASEPPIERDGGRLLLVGPAPERTLTHRLVRELAELLPSPSLLVVNDTRVIPARLHGIKPTGGRVEIFLLRAHAGTVDRWKAFGRASKPIRPGLEITVAPDFRVRIEARNDDSSMDVTLLADDPMAAIEKYGAVPLPPYVSREPRHEDRERYQTLFAQHPGAVAAPTAGLHLSDSLLAQFGSRGIERAAVTLHVGAGTFSPVTVDDLDRHAMHAEAYAITPETAARIKAARAAGRPIIAVGTTVVRALESWGGDGPLFGDTRLLIQPGYRFRMVDQLLTNFHLPRSTLLALVMALAGTDSTRRAYAAAIAERYRFFSYGDAMLIR